MPDADFEHNAWRDWPFWKTSRILALNDELIVGSIALSVRREGTEDRHGSKHLLVLLLDGSEVAGMCEGWWNARFPGRVSQYLTAVARPWRGRGLAKALKARMLRLVRDEQPEVEVMNTYNAVSNAPMLSINTRLGFVRRKEVGTYQTGRDALAAYLATRTPQPGA